MQPSNEPKLDLTPATAGIQATLLGIGIGIPTTVGLTLKQFLCDRLMIAPDYVDNRIQTILMNSRAVDNVDQVRIADGDVIALSAAMPGLAGATLRRGGHLAPMRSTISQAGTGSGADTRQKGIVTLKLFNLVAKEVGPRILSGEICIKAGDLGYLQAHNMIRGDIGLDASDEWVRFLPATSS